MKIILLLLTLLALAACNSANGLTNLSGEVAGCAILNAGMHMTASCTYP